ncbi:MAG: SHOCT domain-containing protein [Pseudomonadota bacterium]|jgi:putative membrane protein
MALFWLVLLLVVLAAAKYLFFSSARSGSAQKETGKAALDYLDESYAKGEISRDEFLQKCEDLKRK